MTRRRRRPAPTKETGTYQNTPPRLFELEPTADDPRVVAGELLRRLAGPILAADDPTDAAVRLGEAAEAAVLVAAGRLDRVAATVTLTTTAQAAGVALVAAEDVIRAALWGAR
jgi:hypothetical protein